MVEQEQEQEQEVCKRELTALDNQQCRSLILPLIEV